MSDFQAIADRVEIEALRMPNIPAEHVGREEIRAPGTTSAPRPATP